MTNVTIDDPQRAAVLEVRRNTFVNALLTKTPAEIDAWFDANVVTVDDMKLLMKRLTQLVSVMAQDIYR
jgi:hypothetical protein